MSNGALLANDQYGGQLWYPLITQDDHHVHLARLQAENDQLKARCDELEGSLEQIAMWPDGGNTYGQDKIKAFASRILSRSEV